MRPYYAIMLINYDTFYWFKYVAASAAKKYSSSVLTWRRVALISRRELYGSAVHIRFHARVYLLWGVAFMSGAITSISRRMHSTGHIVGAHASGLKQRPKINLASFPTRPLTISVRSTQPFIHARKHHQLYRHFPSVDLNVPVVEHVNRRSRTIADWMKYVATKQKRTPNVAGHWQHLIRVVIPFARSVKRRRSALVSNRYNTCVRWVSCSSRPHEKLRELRHFDGFSMRWNDAFVVRALISDLLIAQQQLLISRRMPR